MHRTLFVLPNRWMAYAGIGLLRLCLIPMAASEDHPIDWDLVFGELEERMADEETMARWCDRLLDLSEHPLALNQADKEALETLPFLSPQQVEALSYYLYRYGPMESLAELELVEGLDKPTIECMLPFVCLGDIPSGDKPGSSQKKHAPSKHVFSHQMGRTLETKKGFLNTTTEKERYQGGAWSHTFRYAFTRKERIQAGVTLQKDAGEPWLTSEGRPDFCAVHLVVQHFGLFRRLLLGDYNLTLGQGLICGQGFQLGKTAGISTGNMRRTSLTRHASTAESGYFRGVAVECTLWEQERQVLKPVQVNAIGFVSRRRLDGRLNGDTVTALLATGLHRTPEETKQREVLPAWVIGGQLGCNLTGFRVHLNGIYWYLEKLYLPTEQVYNRFGFKGRQGACLSVDYRWQHQHWSGFGEIAASENRQIAWLNGILLTPCSSMHLTLLYRRYERGFQSLFGQAFGEHETVNNEVGCDLALDWNVSASWTLNGAVDLFRFPWLTYVTDAPSAGQETNLQLTRRWGTDSQLRLRYKTRRLERNRLLSGDKTPRLSEERKQSLRLHQTTSWRQWTLSSTLNTAWLTTDTEQPLETACVFTQSISHSLSAFRMKVTGNLTWFDVSDYAIRISTFEPGLPGTFSMPVFDGQGCHWTLLVSAYPWYWMETWIKLSRRIHADRKAIGTASERLEGSCKTDLLLMVRFKIGGRPAAGSKSLLTLTH